MGKSRGDVVGSNVQLRKTATHRLRKEHPARLERGSDEEPRHPEVDAEEHVRDELDMVQAGRHKEAKDKRDRLLGGPGGQLENLKDLNREVSSGESDAPEAEDTQVGR